MRARSMIAPDMIEAVVHENSRKARKKIRLMLFVRFGPKASLHGMPPWQATEVKSEELGPIGRPGLVAVVDPPAEVVEGRRHDGDRQDVLHRRRHHVLAPGDAGFVGHEARVDQPHQDDGEEVELLAQDGGVLRQGLRAGRLVERLDLGEDERQHPVPSRQPPMSPRTPGCAIVLSSGARTGQCGSGPPFRPNSCTSGTYARIGSRRGGAAGPGGTARAGTARERHAVRDHQCGRLVAST